MDFILIGVGQHGQALVRVASKNNLVKSVGFPTGDERDTFIVPANGIDRGIEVHWREEFHQCFDIRSRSTRNGLPLWPASDGEHSMVLHKIQDKLDRKVKKGLPGTTPDSCPEWHQIVVAKCFSKPVTLEICRD